MDKQQVSTSNASGKAFDPLKPTKEEQDLMIKGYLDGCGGKVLCQDTHPAYRHGYRVGRNDDKGVAEDFQFELIRRQREMKE